MVTRMLDLRALLRGLSAGRFALALLAVWYVTPVDPASPLLTWTLAIPAGLLAWYAAISAVAALRRAVPAGPAVRGAWVAVGCGSLWILALTPWTAWPYAFAALCALAFAVAGTRRHA